MTFAGQYRAIVGPKIRKLCRWRGLKIALGEDRFVAAAAEIMAEASRLGAGFLPPEVLAELPDQIADWLLDAIKQADDDQVALSPIWDDIADHDRRFVATLSHSPSRCQP